LFCGKALFSLTLQALFSLVGGGWTKSKQSLTITKLDLLYPSPSKNSPLILPCSGCCKSVDEITLFGPFCGAFNLSSGFSKVADIFVCTTVCV
jgi:hypothetical protein